jgi:excisionase family DNA binding protein
MPWPQFRRPWAILSLSGFAASFLQTKNKMNNNQTPNPSDDSPDFIPPPLPPAEYTVAQMASLAACSQDKVYDWVKIGVLPRLPHCRHIRIPKRAADEFLRGRDRF